MAGSVADIIAVQQSAEFRDQLVVATTRAAAALLAEDPKSVAFRPFRVAFAKRILENPRGFAELEALTWQVLADATVSAAADATKPDAVQFSAILAAVATAVADQVKVQALAAGQVEP